METMNLLYQFPYQTSWLCPSSYSQLSRCVLSLAFYSESEEKVKI